MAEKSSSDVSREVRMLFQKGNDALLRENYDYAIDLLNQVLDKEPTFVTARQALRTAQFKKAGKAGGFFKKVLSSASSSPQVAKGQMALRKNPAEALQIAEQILNHDPYSSGAHRLVIEAARALELPGTAVMSLEILSRTSPKDKGVAIEFANSLAETGDTARAEQVLITLLRHQPNDNDLAQALKDVSARKTLDEGGYDALSSGEGSYRDILKDSKQATQLEQENRAQKTEDVAQKLINEYEARIKTEPKNMKLYRSLGELYTQKKQFDRALEYYEIIRKSDVGSGDAALERTIADVKIRKMDQAASELNPFLPESAAQLAKIQSDKMEFQISECRARLDRFPTDLSIRFEMGALYFQAGRIGEAIQEFQKSQSNPHKRIASMNYLGQCYAKRKMWDLAARAFQGALKEKPVFDDEKKELIYHLGSVLENMGQKEEAIEQFKQIYEIDIGYKDVAAKVDAYYAGQS